MIYPIFAARNFEIFSEKGVKKQLTRSKQKTKRRFAETKRRKNNQYDKQQSFLFYSSSLVCSSYAFKSFD